jgi:hypothetical protein
MVNGALSIGGLVGVLLSGGFVYWQVGRFAEPQVPRTLFDERKEVFAFTVGLFAGIPLALALLFYFAAIEFGALPAAAIDLALLLLGTELGQWLLLRSVYFGTGESGAFYALGFRAGASGLLALALVTQYLSGSEVSATGFVVVLLQSTAVLVVEVAAGLLSAPTPARLGRLGGSPFAGGIFALFGLFALGVGLLLGPYGALVGALVALVGGIGVYSRLRDRLLSGLLPPRAPDAVEEEPSERSSYRRLTP